MGEPVARRRVVQLGRVRLPLHEEVDQVPPRLPAGRVEDQTAVEAPRPQQGGVERRRAVGRRDDQDVVVRHAAAGLQAPLAGQVAVGPRHEPSPKALAPARRVEGLHLHQQLVDDARVHAHAVRAAERAQRPRAPACRRHPRDAAAAPRDGVDLLDEADRSPFVLRRLAQLLEEAAQAHLRHAEVDVLELRRGREQEGDAGLLRHRLGEVRLAGSRRTLEQHAAAGVAAHVLAERLVRQEDVECALHLVDLAVEPDHLVKADLDLLGPDQPHGRLRRQQREDHHHADPEQGEDAEQGHDHQRVEVREAREGAQPARRPADHPRVDQRQDEDGPAEPHAELAATHPLDVGAALQDVARLLRQLAVGSGWGVDRCGGSLVLMIHCDPSPRPPVSVTSAISGVEPARPIVLGRLFRGIRQRV